MSDQIPFFLHEAMLSLYATGADGLPSGGAIWAGGQANGLRFSHALDEIVVRKSGAAYGKAYHIDEENLLTIERTWLLQKSVLVDFMPARNQQYILQIIWQADGCIFQRTFFGVTGRNVEQNSRGTNQFLLNQTWRAQSFADARVPVTPAGAPPAPAIATPLPPPVGTTPVNFFRENPLLTGDYLLGFYSWPVPVTLTSAKAIAWAPQGAPVVLTLEVNGTLTPFTLTIPVGAANVEVTAAATLNYAVPANAVVRWRVTSAPSIDSTAWHAAVLLPVQGI